MDTVYITGLRAETVIGVYDWERNIRQGVVFAASGDRIEDALDYAAISSRVLAFIEDSEFQLIETMAEQIASLVMAEFRVPWLRLRLGKPGAVAAAETVGVQIERGESP
jgi:dihydroneopterin aldolase